MKRVITDKIIQSYVAALHAEEKKPATIDKYLRDVKNFRLFTQNRPVTKELTLEYKHALMEQYSVSSANSMLAALNSFLRSVGWQEACVRQLKVQKQLYCREDQELSKPDYRALVQIAKSLGKMRLALLLQTVCATGIRISELPYVTVESVELGEAWVSCKGKNRRIFIVPELRAILLEYIAANGIKAGPVFITRRGRSLDRSNIWREMKDLCKLAGVPSGKVFPHNLRHLFARTFYSIEPDIAKLADLLGHSNINTTRIYMMSSGAEHRRKMEAMDLIV